MKKHNLLKVISISFLVMVLLSWIIPVGSISSGTYTAGSTEPIGIIGLFRTPIMTIQTFIQYAIVFLAIGAFYGVLERLGCYSDICEKITNRHSKKPVVFLIISMLFFAILTSLTGSTMYMFAFVPFFATITLGLGYNKITAFATTVGAILVGQIGSIYGFSIVGYYINVLSIGINAGILTRVIIFIATTGLFVFLMTKYSKKNILAIAKDTLEEGIETISKKVEAAKAKKVTTTKVATKKTTAKASVKKTATKKATTKKTTAKKGTKADMMDNVLTLPKKGKNKIPFLVITFVFILIGFVGLYNWHYSFGLDTFSNLDTTISNIKIGGFSIVSKVLGNANVLGYWGNYELAVLLFGVAALLSWIYNLKIDEFFDAVWAGIKKMAPVALVATLANIVFYVMVAGGDGNIYNTAVNWISGFAKSFNLWTSSLVSLIGSLLNNDYYYVISSASTIFGAYDKAIVPLACILSGAIYGVVMLVAPTSVLLMAGLKYFEVSYKEWIKYIWKFTLYALAISLFVVTLMYAFI